MSGVSNADIESQVDAAFVAQVKDMDETQLKAQLD